jgi:hypothetical protein
MGNRMHGLRHLSMRSIFVLRSLLAFSTHQRVTFPYNSEGQETGAIAPVPENARKKIGRRGRSRP